MVIESEEDRWRVDLDRMDDPEAEEVEGERLRACRRGARGGRTTFISFDIIFLSFPKFSIPRKVFFKVGVLLRSFSV